MSFTINEQSGAVSFAIHVKPRANRDEVIGTHGDALSIRIAAPPVDGAANDAIRRFFSKTLRVSASSVEIIAGQTGKTKIIKISGVTANAILSLLPNTNE